MPCTHDMSYQCRSCRQVDYRKDTIATGKTNCHFAGSFFNLEQLPKDSRPQIAIAGRSNVGKSSLLNRLTGGKGMARVSKSPGKTRSLNFYLVNGRFYFVDLPGYGYAKVPKKIRSGWGKLIGDYLDQSENLIGLILLLDCRREAADRDLELVSWLAKRRLAGIAVITKTDKLTRDKVNRKAAEIESNLGLVAIPFSAVSGVGKRELLRAVDNLVAEKTTSYK